MNVSILCWRKKNKYINFIIILLALLTSITTILIIKDYYKMRIFQGPGKYIENRSFYVDVTNDEKLKNLDYIEKIYPIYNSEESIISNIKVNYDSELKGNECLISNFSPHNTKIESEINNYNLECIGYSDKKNADLFISKEKFTSIYNKSVPIRYLVVLNNYYDSPKFMSYLENNRIMGYQTDSTKLQEIYILESDLNNLQIIVDFVILICGVMIYFGYKKIIIDNYKDIMLLKFLGYSNKSILWYIIKLLLMISAVSIVMELVIILAINFLYPLDIIRIVKIEFIVILMIILFSILRLYYLLKKHFNFAI